MWVACHPQLPHHAGAERTTSRREREAHGLPQLALDQFDLGLFRRCLQLQAVHRIENEVLGPCPVGMDTAENRQGKSSKGSSCVHLGDPTMAMASISISIPGIASSVVPMAVEAG